MITGSTKVIGIIGWPVAHSLSPAMQNAAFKAAAIDCVYIPLPVKTEDLGRAVEGIRTLGFLGANVTVPHKEKIMEYLDEVHPDALKVGAVNTIVVSNGRLIGYNTDVGGFSAALDRHQVDVKEQKALLLGAGGAAKAVLQSLLNNGCTDISVGARSGEKAGIFAERFDGHGSIKGFDWLEDDFKAAYRSADIIINTTPVGMDGIAEKALPVVWSEVDESAFVADIVYNPPLTAFLRQAKMRGCRGMNGLAMLVEQGALAFELWLGKEPPREIMYEILLQKI